MKNSKIQNGAPFLVGQFFFLKTGSATRQKYPLGQNFIKIAPSSTVFEIQAFLCFAFLKKNLKIQNGRHFWPVKYLLKLGKASLHRHRGSKILPKFH